MPRPVALLAAVMVSNLKVNGYVDMPGLKVDGLKALSLLEQVGGTTAEMGEAIDVSIRVMKEASRRRGVPWMTDEDEHITRILLEKMYKDLQIGRPDLVKENPNV
jgi:hypothetical protein